MLFVWAMVGWVTSPFFLSDFLKLVYYAHIFPCTVHVHVCCVALPCCLFDHACFFLRSFSSLIKTCKCTMYMHVNLYNEFICRLKTKYM